MTSSGGVPSNSVIMENWLTSTRNEIPKMHVRRREVEAQCWDEGALRSFPGKRGFPSSISAKMHPVLQISTVAKQPGNTIYASVKAQCHDCLVFSGS